MNALTIVVLLATLLGLAAAGGGIFVPTAAAAALALALLWSTWLTREARAPEPASTCGYPDLQLCFGLSLAFLLIMMLPLPELLARVGGPGRAAQNARVASALDQAVALDLVENSGDLYAMTRNRAGTARFLLLTVLAGCALLTTARLAPRARRPLVQLILVAAALVSVAGTIARWHSPQGDTLWWLFPLPFPVKETVAGFVSRNHYAGFLAMCAGAALGLTTSDLARRKWLGASLAAVLCGVLAVGVALSESRGGAVALAATIGGVACCWLMRRRIVAGVALLLLVPLVCAAFWFMPIPAVQARMRTLLDPMQATSVRMRLGAARDCLDIWQSYPVLGAGPHAFRNVFPQHRTSTKSAFMSFAENDYAQLVADGGAVGFVLAAAVLLALTRRSMARARDEPEIHAMRPVCAGAAAAAVANAAVDFPLHLPLYALACAIFVGSALVPGEPRARLLRIFASRRTPLFAIAATCVLAAVAGLWRAPMWERRDAEYHMQDADAEELVRVLTWSPTSWHAWYYFGKRVAREQSGAVAEFRNDCMEQALRYDPNNYRLHLAVGKFRLRIGDHDGARRAFTRVRELRTWVPIPTVPAD